MINNLNDKTTQDIYDGTNSRYARKVPKELHKKTCRLLDQINAVTKVEELRKPPGNNLEKLKGNWQNYWSLRINQQWRIIFRWFTGNAYDVQIIDYHH